MTDCFDKGLEGKRVPQAQTLAFGQREQQATVTTKLRQPHLVTMLERLSEALACVRLPDLRRPVERGG